jgi:predicted ABC-type ATPase
MQLPSAEYAVARVTQRARLGGHTIPEEDIRRRFDRGARLFEELYKSLVPEWYHWHSDDQGLRLAERS